MKLSFFTLFASLLLLTACGESAESTAALPAAEATHAKVEFYKKSDFTFFIEVPTGEKMDILKGLVTADHVPLMKCAYDGQITYFAGEKTILVGEFNLGESCNHIVYMEGDEVQSRRLSKAGGDLLRKMRGPKAPEPKTLAGFEWMLGTWMQKESADAISYEQWEKTSDTRYAGRAFTVVGSDTAFSESIELVVDGQDIYYKPNVSHNAGPVPFKMIEFSGQKAIFENPAHDFPKTIVYEMLNDTLHARIAGLNKGVFGAKDFYLTRLGDSAVQ